MRCKPIKVLLMAMGLGGCVSVAQAGGPTNEGSGGGLPVIPAPGGSGDSPGPALPDQPSSDNPAKNPSSNGGSPFTRTSDPPTVRPCALTEFTWIQIHLNGEKVWIQIRNPLGGCP